MRIYALFIPVSLITILAGCSGGKREGIAHITQRRLDKDGKLVISYQFHDGGKLVSDSMALSNTVVPHDSVKVIFSPENPKESRLILP